MARHFLESPGWGKTESPPEAEFLDVESDEIMVAGCPVDAIPSSDDEYLFVSLQTPDGTQRTPGSIAVMRQAGESFDLQQTIHLPAAPWGLALVRNERVLAVANSHGVTLIDATKARAGAQDAIIGVADYGRNLYTNRVLESADGNQLFASDEHNSTVSVLDISKLDNGNFDADCLISQIPVDLLPVGMELSADGRFLYTTCEMKRVRAPDLVNWFVWGATLGDRMRRAGVVCTVDVQCAIRAPEKAVVSKHSSGGHPVRIKLSGNGKLAWVAARASNQLLAFDLQESRSPRFVAAAPVGPAPAGLAVLDALGIILVANTDRFAVDENTRTVTVIDSKRALAGLNSCLGKIRVGSFPREIRLNKLGEVAFVTNFDSQSVSMLSLRSLKTAVNAVRADTRLES